MKRNIFYLIISLCLGVFHAHAQETTITYSVIDGIESLSCDNIQSYLYKPIKENSYYLYTNSSVIRIKCTDNKNLPKKHIDILSGTDQNGVWPYLPDSTKTGFKKTKHSKQPFSIYFEQGCVIKRDDSRARALVKDQISIGGLNCYIWNPIHGTVDFSATVNDIKYHAGDTIHVKAGENVKISLRAIKNGDGIILQKLFVGDSLLTAGDIVDEITKRNTKFESSFEKSFSKDDKSIGLSLEYQTLDENFHLENITEKIYVEIDNNKSISTLLLLLIIFTSISGIILLLWAKISPKCKNFKNQEPKIGFLIQINNDWKWFGGNNLNGGEDDTIIRTKDIDISYINSIILVFSRSARPNKDWQKGNRDQFFEIIAEVEHDILNRIKNKVTGNGGELVQIKSLLNKSVTKIDIIDNKNKLRYPIPIKFEKEKQNEKDAPNSITGKDNNDNLKPTDAIEKDLILIQEKLVSTQDQLSQTTKELVQKKAELISNNELLLQKEGIISSYKCEIKRLEAENVQLIGDCNDIRTELKKEIEEHAKTRTALELVEAQADERIAQAKQECQKKILEKEEECVDSIERARQECDARTSKWKADKEFFIERINNPLERLYDISDEINRNIESQDKSYNESIAYIVSSLYDFSEKVKLSASESGNWRTVTNCEAEKSIVFELTELIKNNSSWINSIARLYCYSQIKEIGAMFEENGIHISDIDSVYRDMCYLLGLCGINIVVPRILVDYYNDINKKYFNFNNEDIIITQFAGRDILIRNKESLKIYDMGKIAYYLNGKITKGEIVHF